MIEIYTRDNCSYCVKAKHLLNSKAIPYIEHHIGTAISREAVLGLFPGAQTVPIVVVDGTWIGGFNELNTYVNNSGEQLICG